MKAMHLLTPTKSAGLAALLLPLLATFAQAQNTLYYDPASTNTTTAGGTGTSTGSVWYTGSERHTWSTGVTGSIATYWNLVYGGTGQTSTYTYTTALSSLVLPTGTSSALNQLNLIFQGDYIYTKSTGQTNTSLIGSQNDTTNGRYSYLNLYASPGKTVSFVAGTDTGGLNQITLLSLANNSTTPSVLLSGGGTITMGKNTNILQFNAASPNGHIHVGEANLATTLNLNTGSTVTGHRLQVANGTVNVNGGTVSLSGAGSARANSAITLGGGTAADGFTAVTFNLTSGTVSALPGSANAYGYGAHGVTFAVNPTSTSTTAYNDFVGGTFNLNGGTLTTTDIYANPNATGATTAKFNFNGGTLVVSSAATQDQLNGLITGFQDTATNHVNIGSNGAKIDTGSINTGTTNGVATIASVIRGAGGLQKLGANTLKLDALNTYTGNTVISAGTLALGANGGLASSAIAIANGATLDTSARTSFRLATGQNLEVTGTGVFIGTLGVGSDSTTETITLSNNLNFGTGSGLLFDLGALSDHLVVTDTVSTAGNVNVHLNFLSGFGAGTYTLMSAALVNSPSHFVLSEDNLLAGYNYDLQSTATGLQLSVTAIPEPATYALLGGLLAIGLVAWRRRNRA